MIVQPMLISAWTASSTSVFVSTLFAFYLLAEEVQARPALSMRTALLRETSVIMASVRLQAAEVTLAMLAVLTPTALLRETNAIMASVRLQAAVLALQPTIVQQMLLCAWTVSSTFACASTLFVSKPELEAEVTPAMLAVLTPTAPPQETSVTTASVRPLGEATATVVPMQLTVSSL
jgi:hypothetical protein